MNLNTAWEKYKNPIIRQQIQENMKAVKAFENHLPFFLTIHDAQDVSLVYMSKSGTDHLGIDLEDITLSFQEYHSRFFNLEDAQDYVPKVTGLLQRNDPGEIVTFFQQVRSSPQHDWTWYLSATKIFMHDLDGKPLFFITVSIPIDAKSHVNAKVERLKEENLFLKNNYHLFSQLTKREKEILKYLAMGFNPKELADKICLSEKTVVTHKRNLRAKLKIQSPVELVKFAQAFDLL